MIRTCSVSNCDRKHVAKGLCHKHYYAAWRALPTSKPIIDAYQAKFYNKPEKRAVKNANRARISRTVRGRFLNAKNQAQRRGLCWELSFEQYERLISGICYYSGHSLPAAGAGLDRKDSAQGYTIENVVPCCTVCNEMKMDRSVEEFMDHVNAIISLHPCRDRANLKV